MIITKLKITIEGEIGSGKTQIKNLLVEALRNKFKAWEIKSLAKESNGQKEVFELEILR